MRSKPWCVLKQLLWHRTTSFLKHILLQVDNIYQTIVRTCYWNSFFKFDISANDCKDVFASVSASTTPARPCPCYSYLMPISHVGQLAADSFSAQGWLMLSVGQCLEIDCYRQPESWKCECLFCWEWDRATYGLRLAGNTDTWAGDNGTEHSVNNRNSAKYQSRCMLEILNKGTLCFKNCNNETCSFLRACFASLWSARNVMEPSRAEPTVTADIGRPWHSLCAIPCLFSFFVV